MSENKGGYIGITIGPVVETLVMAHTPAAMWYASRMFSRLTEELCKELCAAGIPKENIISPFYSGEDFTDGIGRYHDRVVVHLATKEMYAQMAKITDKAKETIAKEVMADMENKGEKELTEKELAEKEKAYENELAYIKNYLQIHYVYLPAVEGNSLLEVNNILDNLEQMVSPNKESTDNPLAKLFKGDRFVNEYVSQRINAIDKSSQLKTGGKLKCIGDIAQSPRRAGGRYLKQDKYYAVVQADGDNMGSYISTLETDKAIQEFSQRCLDYTSAAAKLIGSYGGMTIYAGGDDLLFMAPLQGNDGMDIFSLCVEIAKLFSDNVVQNTTGEKVPTVSFGISIRYEKFPLYEALKSSISALFDIAKSKEVGRNAMVIDFHKGSGQAVKMVVPMQQYEVFHNMFESYTGGDEDMLKSVIYMLDAHRPLFDVAYKEDDEAQRNLLLKNIMKNCFDNSEQEKYAAFVQGMAERVAAFFAAVKDGRAMFAFEHDKHTDAIKTVEAILRLSKFMIEEKGR